MDPYRANELLKRMRKGEQVTCPHCGKGIMIATGDPKISHFFQCNVCKAKWSID